MHLNLHAILSASLLSASFAAAAASVPDTALKVPEKTDSVIAKQDSAVVHKPRPRVVRETTVNPLNAIKGRYRSPKKALFMSLVVPGLGQAYVGQSVLNYSRAAAYLGVDIALGILWYQYVVIKHDRQVKKYRRFADENWSQKRYEDSLSLHSDSTKFAAQNPFRESYCDAVVRNSAGDADDSLRVGCKDLNNFNYRTFQAYFARDFTGADSADSVHNMRAGFEDIFSFYELIGKEQEFIAGWKDANNVSYARDSLITGTSAMRDQYISIRGTANRYARMQAWFLGGIVVNHIASAVDAALTAHHHNQSLYQSETRWYDRLHLNGGLAFDGAPRTVLTASVAF